MSDLFGNTSSAQSSLEFPQSLTERYRPRCISDFALLRSIWEREAPATAAAPNFARIVKDSNNNVRAALMALETELLIAC